MLIQSAQRLETIPEQFFHDDASYLKVVDLHTSNSQPISHKSYKIRSADVYELMKQNEDSAKDHSFMRLVGVLRTYDGRIHMEPKSFHHLLKAFNISPEVLYMIEYSVIGFYSFTCENGDTKSQSYYVNDFARTLVWSRDLSNNRIYAVLVCAEGRATRAYLSRFPDVMHRNACLAEQPMFLPLACAVETIHYVNWRLRDLKDNIRHIEAQFGFSSWRQPDLRELVDTDVKEMTAYTRAIATSLVDLKDVARRLEAMIPILKQIQDLLEDATQITDPGPPALIMKQSTSHLLQQAQSAQYQSSYLHSRAQNQFTVLFNLTGQRDAITNIDLATQARDDSYSMKTVAVMTMAFLPATFFAALFAMPSLQWTADTIITNRFWIYWAFTLPVTFVVFAIWLAITKALNIYSFAQSKFTRKAIEKEHSTRT